MKFHIKKLRIKSYDQISKVFFLITLVLNFFQNFKSSITSKLFNKNDLNQKLQSIINSH